MIKPVIRVEKTRISADLLSILSGTLKGDPSIVALGPSGIWRVSNATRRCKQGAGSDLGTRAVNGSHRLFASVFFSEITENFSRLFFYWKPINLTT